MKGGDNIKIQVKPMGEDSLVEVELFTMHLECKFYGIDKYPSYEIIAYKEDNLKVVIDYINNTNDLSLVRKKFEEVKKLKDEHMSKFNLHVKGLVKLREENPGMQIGELLQTDNSDTLDELTYITLNEEEFSQVNDLDEREIE